jgi:hypothetical protein
MNAKQRTAAALALLMSLAILSCRFLSQVVEPTAPPLTDLLAPPATASMDTPAGAQGTASEWQGIPIMPGATNGQEVSGAYGFHTTASVEDITAYYKEALPKLGWVLVPDPANLMYRKGDSFLAVNITSFGADDNYVGLGIAGP